jgi:hypothetical protein
MATENKPIQIQLRRGNTEQNGRFTGAPGEITMDTELKNFRIHDGNKMGGWTIDKAEDVVHKTGNETIAGIKVFTETIHGTASSALWADLAENYQSDEKYPIGTLIRFGGKKDITIAQYGLNCNGVISDKPGYLLDEGLEESLPVALVGKTPVRVIGKIQKFDRIVLSPVSGVAKAQTTSDEKVVGIALESSDIEEEKLVKCVVKISLD